MTRPAGPQQSLLGSWFSTTLDLAGATFSAIDSCLWRRVEPLHPEQGPDFETTRSPTGPIHWKSGPLHIDSETATPVRLYCPGLRQIGGGQWISPERITFAPHSVVNGPNRVVATVDMTGIGVGMWTGDIVSRHNPEIHMSPNPLMPTWAGPP